MPRCHSTCVKPLVYKIRLLWMLFFWVDQNYGVALERLLNDRVTFGRISSRYEPYRIMPLHNKQHHGMVWHRKYFLPGPIKVCGVIFRQQHIQFGLGQGRARAGSQLCKSSFSYSTRGDLRSISGWRNLSPRGSSHNTIDDDKTRKILWHLCFGHWRFKGDISNSAFV